MTLRNKKILLATVAATSLYPLTLFSPAEAASGEKIESTHTVINDDSYSIDGETTAHSSNYDLVHGGYSGFDFNNFSYTPSWNMASGKFLTINGGTISGAVGGFSVFSINGTNSAQNVFGNRVIINGGRIGHVSGGEVAYYIPYGVSASDIDWTQPRFLSGDVGKNSVEIYGGTITGGVIGGSTLTQSAYENSVTVADGVVSGGIIGGEIIHPTEGSSIRDNKINIEGGTVSGDIIAAKIDDTTANVSVTNNSVHISNKNGNLNLSGANLIGVSGDRNFFTPENNVLHINASGLNLQSISGFDKIILQLPYEVQSGDTVLTLSGSNSTYLGLDRVGISMHGNSNLRVGDTIRVLYNPNGINTDSTDYSGLASSADGTSGASFDGGTITRGSTAVYGMNLATSADGNELIARLNEVVRDEGNPIPESANELLANLIPDPPDPFTELMTEKIADDDAENTDATDTLGVHEASGFSIFFNVGGGKIKTKTGDGTWTNSKKGNYDFGLARSIDSKYGTWYFAPLVEYAQGNYDSLLPNGIRGYGNTKYTAGGVIARRLNNNGFYYETSLRLGRAESDFASNDFIVQGEKTRVTYNMSTPVFAGHVRVGVAKKLGKSNVLDIYGIYAYARQNDMDTDLSSGEHVEFSSVHASRFRIGYRLTSRTSKISRVYTGLAYQYETVSDATATAIDYSKRSKGLKGSSGMIELGWQIKPSKSNPWLLDINATGWVGYQRGFNATARMQRSI